MRRLRSVGCLPLDRRGIVFHVKRRSLLQGIIGRGRAAATPRDRKHVRVTELSTEPVSSTEQSASLVHDPEAWQALFIASLKSRRVNPCGPTPTSRDR